MPAEALPTGDISRRCAVCGANEWERFRAGHELYLERPQRLFTLAHCGSCGHVAQAPPPTDDDLRRTYSSPYAPYRPGWKEKRWPLWRVLRQITTLRRIFRLRHYAKGNKLLEVGPGAGDFLYQASRAGWQVSAVEYSDQVSAMLRKELHLDVRAGELAEGMWEAGTFDCVVLWSVLEHVRDPLLLLNLAARYLRTGGTVLIQLPTREGAEVGEFYGEHWVLLEFPRHLNFFNQNSLTELCKEAGLSLVLYKTPLLDTVWCYLASGIGLSNRSKHTFGRIFRLLLIAFHVLILLPWMTIGAWRGRGTEAFAVGVKK